MRKICLINQKGGVGKTTTAINLGVGLAKAGKRVLIVDIDPQGNVSSCLPVESEKGLFEFLIEDAEQSECITEVRENLFVMPGKENLTKAQSILVGEPNREMFMRRKFANIVGFDYFIVDCAPSLGLLNQNAMLLCDEAVIPVSTDVLGLDGLNKMIAAIQKMNEVFDHRLTVTKIVPTMHDLRNKICKQSLGKMLSDYYGVVADPVHLNAKLKEAPASKKAIFEYAKKSRAADDYAKLVQQILADEEKYDRKGIAPLVEPAQAAN